MQPIKYDHPSSVDNFLIFLPNFNYKSTMRYLELFQIKLKNDYVCKGKGMYHLITAKKFHLN